MKSNPDAINSEKNLDSDKMAVILDTSVLIEIERGNKKVLKKLDDICKIYPEKPYITQLTVSEFIYGTLNRSSTNQVQALNKLKQYNFLNTTVSSSILLAHLDSVLTKKGKKIPPFDIFIASLAIDNDMPLVTRDCHFKEISGLNLILI